MLRTAILAAFAGAASAIQPWGLDVLKFGWNHRDEIGQGATFGWNHREEIGQGASAVAGAAAGAWNSLRPRDEVSVPVSSGNHEKVAMERQRAIMNAMNTAKDATLLAILNAHDVASGKVRETEAPETVAFRRGRGRGRDAKLAHDIIEKIGTDTNEILEAVYHPTSFQSQFDDLFQRSIIRKGIIRASHSIIRCIAEHYQEENQGKHAKNRQSTTYSASPTSTDGKTNTLRNIALYNAASGKAVMDLGKGNELDDNQFNAIVCFFAHNLLILTFYFPS